MLPLLQNFKLSSWLILLLIYVYGMLFPSGIVGDCGAVEVWLSKLLSSVKLWTDPERDVDTLV